MLSKVLNSLLLKCVQVVGRQKGKDETKQQVLPSFFFFLSLLSKVGDSKADSPLTSVQVVGRQEKKKKQKNNVEM